MFMYLLIFIIFLYVSVFVYLLYSVELVDDDDEEEDEMSNYQISLEIVRY